MGRGSGIKECWSDTCWKLKNDQYRLCDVCCGWGTTCGCCCACCKNCVISQTSCISSTILMVAWLGMLLSWFFPFHASDHSGPYDCAYEIRLRGGTGDFLYASCKHTPDIIENPPDGATSGYLKEVHYTQKDYDDYIYACITLMVSSVKVSPGWCH